MGPRKITRKGQIPAATLSGRAIGGKGMEEFMLFNASSRVLPSGIASHAFVVDAKDDKAAQFYQRYGFRFFVEGGRRLFIRQPRSPNCSHSVFEGARMGDARGSAHL